MFATWIILSLRPIIQKGMDTGCQNPACWNPACNDFIFGEQLVCSIRTTDICSAVLAPVSAQHRHLLASVLLCWVFSELKLPELLFPVLFCLVVFGFFWEGLCLDFWFYSQPIPQIESECSSKWNLHLQVYNPNIFNLFAKLKKLDQWDRFPLRVNESCPFPFLQNLLLFWFYFM